MKQQFHVLFTVVVLTGCGTPASDTSPQDASTENVPSEVLALNWYAEAEHGGYVAASQLGYYDEVGVDVTVQPGGPGAPTLVIQELAAGRIRFAISNADLVILSRARGAKIVAVAAPLQQSPRCIMVHESSGIESLQQLADIELAISDTRPFALWMKKQLPLTNVTMVPYAGLVGEFLQKKNFAQQGYVFSEPFVAKEKGGDPKVLMLSDIGFNPYASLLVTTEETIRKDPQLVRNMVAASVRGWHAYLNDPLPVNERIHAENKDMTLEALDFGAKSMLPLCSTPENVPLCGMELKRWRTLVEQIEQLGEIQEGAVDPATCFSTEFLSNELSEANVGTTESTSE
ncbi:MAG: ABC transporter substrate-binding protein [Fuerstiella sp.]|nr:ABC transporter substrate-binding protein [Fuerstiella sp.]MCP4857795.1 ABC transporter substrate-binding protein [Fuerstiella sp.]